MADRPAAIPAPTWPAAPGLTAGQMRVMTLLMQGKSNKAICRSLGLAEPTVKRHVSAILKALKVSNRTEAALAVSALGLASSPNGTPSRLSASHASPERIDHAPLDLPDVPSTVVLPFANLSRDPRQNYF